MRDTPNLRNLRNLITFCMFFENASQKSQTSHYFLCVFWISISEISEVSLPVVGFLISLEKVKFSISDVGGGYWEELSWGGTDFA